MLMKPIGWRHKEATGCESTRMRGCPLPKKGIAFTREDHDMRAGSVPVPPRISPGRILLQMGAHRISGEVEPDSRGSLTS